MQEEGGGEEEEEEDEEDEATLDLGGHSFGHNLIRNYFAQLLNGAPSPTRAWRSLLLSTILCLFFCCFQVSEPISTSCLVF